MYEPSQHVEPALMNQQTICFVAGRSGGHLLPAVTLAKIHKNSHPNDSLMFFTTATTLDKKITDQFPFIDTCIALDLENIPQKILQYPKFLLHAFKTLLHVMKILRLHKPQKVVSMGGYISVPVCLAAYLLRIPIEIHELNVIPGKANLFIAPRATQIFICFGASATYFKRACKLVDYPVRFTQEQRLRPQLQALHLLNLSPAKKTVCIFGGSQGSLFINNAMKEWIIKTRELHHAIQIIHQTGGQDTTDWKNFYQSLSIQAVVFDYNSSIDPYYTAADLIVCRAGAGTLFEIQFFNKRCITIPLETATTAHQLENARAMSQQSPHLFVVIEQAVLEKNPTILHSALNQQLRAMINNDNSLFKPINPY